MKEGVVLPVFWFLSNRTMDIILPEMVNKFGFFYSGTFFSLLSVILSYVYYDLRENTNVKSVLLEVSCPTCLPGLWSGTPPVRCPSFETSVEEEVTVGLF